MATTAQHASQLTMADMKGRVDPDWCPACGDGDGFGIGGNHFVHSMRRNVDLLYIVMDNQIYGLTTGQTSPTSRVGMKTKSMPFGNIEAPVNPISLALPSWRGAIAPNRSTSRN